MWTKGVGQFYCSYGSTTIFNDRGSVGWMFRDVTFTADVTGWSLQVAVGNSGGIVTDVKFDALTIAFA
jgi:hypothetical protein